MYGDIISELRNSAEPSIRFKALVEISNKKPQLKTVKKLQEQIKKSPRVEKLLSERGRDGKIPYHPYRKWAGGHWALACLSDLGYPAGDKALIPLREQMYEWLFSKKHEESIRTIRGRVRRCASQESYALYYLIKLGLTDDRTHELARKLIKWQWPDGGWNCDKKPGAVNSSFVESVMPLRALALYSKTFNDKSAEQTARLAAELFLKRNLFKRVTDGSIITPRFIKLHYPCYYEYDILAGLKAIAEIGCLDDSRCKDALDLLESKRLADGGFPAEEKLYKVANNGRVSRGSLVDWGGTSKKRFNEFVTADALIVLKRAERLE